MRVTSVLLALGLVATPASAFKSNLPMELSEETESCLECHKDDNPGIYQQWGAGKHFGANVGCYECH
jgi:hydroxylamine dehydrogenase